MLIGRFNSYIMDYKNIMNIPYNFHYAKLARNLSQHKKPMGAAIFRHGKLISIGCNIQKTHPQFTNLYSIHAEIKAIISAQTNLDGCDIYVYRQNKNGHLAMAKPCTTCQQMIIEAGIRRVFYTDNEGYKEL